MNPEFENTRQALEARLTALLLDELPEGEALALKEIVERDAELSKLYRRLKQTIDLVRETTVQPVAQGAPATAPLKLSDQRRQELLQRFKTVRPKEFEEPKRTLISRLVPVAAVAAVILLVAAIAMPNFTKARATSIKNAVINNLRQIDAAKQQWALENQKSQAEVPTPSDLAPYFHDGRLPQISDETYVLGRVGDPVVAEVEAAQARKSFGGFTAKLPAGGTRGQKVSLSMDGQIAYVNNAAKTSFGNQSMSGSDIRANPPAFVGPPVASASSDFATTPARRTMPSIVLPVGNADQDDLNRIAPAPDVPPAALVPPAESVATFGIPAKGDVSGVAGGAAQQFSRAKLQEGLRNSGDAGDPGKFVPHSVSGGGGGAGPAAIPQQTVTLADSPPAATVAPARPSNEESFRARYGSPPRSPSPLASAKPGQSAADGRGLYYESAVADRSGEARTPAAVGELTAGVPVLTTNIAGAIDPATGLPPGVNAFAEGAGNQNKALGFDWYLGNSLAGKDKPAAQSGLPPAEGDKLTVAAKPTRGGRVLNRESAAASAEPRSLVKSFTGLAPGANSSPATPRQEIVLPDDTLQQNKELALQLHRDTDGAVDRLSEKSPVLGDVPLAGRMFRPESDSSGTRGEERGRLQVTNTSGVAWNGGLSGVQTQNHFFDLGDITKSGATPSGLNAGESAGGVGAGSNVASVNIVGYVNLPTNANNYAFVAQPVPKTKLALRNVYNKDNAALNQLGELKETPASAQTSAGQTEFAKKRELEELQRFRQLLNYKIASEKIDTTISKSSPVTIVDRATAEPEENRSLWQKLTGSHPTSPARVKIERDQSDISELQGRAGSGSGFYDPYFVQTETEVLKSEMVLGKVIQDLNLKEAWGNKYGEGKPLKTEEAVDLLKKKIDLEPVKNSGLVEIRVKADTSAESANLANKVAEAYRDYRLEQRKKLNAGGIVALEERFNDQEQKVRKVQAEVDKLRREAKVSDDADKASATLAAKETDEPPAARPAVPPPVPQPEVATRDNAYSTFSLNVSDVSFKLAGASLEKGQMPDPASIRSEEFINAFDYRDPEPPAGVPVAFAWERAQYPFAQNRDLLRFSLKTAAQGRQPGRPLNVVLLLDNSGSMERADRVQIIREALKVLASQLQPQDKFSVVTFARTPRLWVDGVPGDQAAPVADEVSGLTPQGGTNLEEAMNLAYQTAARHYLGNGINRVVLLTDGAANLGNVDPESLKQKVEAQRKQGIALDCFGIGWEGYNDDLLEVLSRNGDGRYGFINTPGEVATEFAGQLAGALQVAASDVKVQVEFNPQRVTSYRQIGYAKHQLTKEQFRDNTVDAAEIGAAESGNALYTVEVNPAGEGPLATVRVRYKIPGTSDYREQEWAVPFTGGAVGLEQATPAMRLAASASAFSEWLATSPYAGEVNPDRLLGYLGGVPDVYGADVRPKRLEWMIRQAKSLAGK